MRRTLFLAGLTACSLTACTDSTAPVIQAEDPPAFQLQWGWFGVEPGRFKRPAAIDIGPDGSIYVADQTPRVQKFAPDGTFITSWGFPPPERLHGYQYLNALAVSRFGVYVAEVGTDLGDLYRFSTDGALLDVWPCSRTGKPVENGLAVDETGLVYLSPTTSRGLRILAPDGKLIDTWPDAPAGALATGPGGTLFLLEHVDPYGPHDGTQVWEFQTASGSLIRKWPIMERPHQPRDITVAGDAVYVVLGFQSPARKYTLGGRLLSEWTETDANHEPLQTPGSLVPDARGDLYIADYSQNRVVKFAYP